MTFRTLARLACAVALPLTALVAAPAPALADGCPDVDLVFARGTADTPGLGVTGTSFLWALQATLGGRSVGASPIDYPASGEFENRAAIAHSVGDGIRFAGNHIRFMANACPNTRIVLSGYSQGAAVAVSTTADHVPAGVPADFAASLGSPFSADVAGHVAAVVLFGAPSQRFLAEAEAPQIAVGGSFASKTLWLCNPGDNICDGSPLAGPNINHGLYSVNGATITGAQFVASRL